MACSGKGERGADVKSRSFPHLRTGKLEAQGEINRFGAPGPGLKLGPLSIFKKVVPVCHGVMAGAVVCPVLRQVLCSARLLESRGWVEDGLSFYIHPSTQMSAKCIPSGLPCLLQQGHEGLQV